MVVLAPRHLPPFRQSQSLRILSLQSKPMKPSGHSHTYPWSASTQVPPFWHGLERQGEGTT